MEAEKQGFSLPPDAAVLAEMLGERLGLGKGDPGGLELRYGPDGSLRKWRRLEEGGRDALARFGEPSAEG